MSTLLVLLLGLTVATCAIAYWSDNLGKNLGKKRVSLFNLRPRQTATLITMASSVAIMLFTIAALLVTNRSIRNALLRFDTVRENLSVAKRDLADAQQANTTLAEKSSELGRKVDEQQQRLQHTQEDLRRADRQRSVAQRSVIETQTKLKSAQARLENANLARVQAQQGEQSARQGELSARQAEAAAEGREQQAQTRLNSVNANFGRVSARLTSARTRLTSAQTRFSQAQTRLTQAYARLRSAQARLRQAESKQRLAEAREGLARSSEAKVRKNLPKLQRATVAEARKAAEASVALQIAEAKVTARQTELAEAEARLQRVNAEANVVVTRVAGFADEYLEVAKQFAEGNVIATPDTVLASRVVPANSSRAQLSDAVGALLRDGSGQAQKLGASEGAELQPILLDSERVLLSSDEIVRRLLDHLEGARAPISLRLLPVRYHAQGEAKLRTRFSYVRVTPALEPNELLATTTLDPAQGDARTFNALLTLLNDGEKAARAQGVLPVPSPQEPFYALGTNERLFDVLRLVQREKSPVSVRLLAAEEISTSEPVRVRFAVE